jgi:hypothetical protein
MFGVLRYRGWAGPIMLDVVQTSCRVWSLTHLTGFQVGEVRGSLSRGPCRPFKRQVGLVRLHQVLLSCCQFVVTSFCP